jgi:hypothetical protein
MQLRMPRGQVVSPRRRGYAGNCDARQAFFSYFFDTCPGQNLTFSATEAVVFPRPARGHLPEDLIVRKIIRPILRWRSKYLIALDDSSAMSARSEFIFPRVRRDDSGAARRQTINQPSIGRNSDHSNAHRTLARGRCRGSTFLFVP